jgi:Ca2+-binding EF-hand superfamily protein
MKIPARILAGLLVTALAVPSVALAAKADRKNKNEGADKAAGAFSKADKNSDGSVTESEFVAVRSKKGDDSAAKKQFARLDKNSDGKLTQEEFSAATAGGKGGKGGKKKSN